MKIEKKFFLENININISELFKINKNIFQNAKYVSEMIQIFRKLEMSLVESSFEI